jgi:hypothetical protein
MNFKSINKKSLHILFSIIAIAIVIFLVREITIDRNSSPLDITYKVRNLSAKEDGWQIATAVQTGDVVEHFLLVHLPEDYSSIIPEVNILAQASNGNSFIDNTFSSKSRGINEDSPEQVINDLFTKDGINLKEIKPGEFVDLKWHTLVSEDIQFRGLDAPLFENRTIISSKDFSQTISRTILSLFSTLERSKIVDDRLEQFFMPKVVGMNPREVYDDLGSGVLIAGEDLLGVNSLRISENNIDLAFRAISNDLIEAGIPEGLEAGFYHVELLDKKDKSVGLLDLEVLSSSERTVVVNVTPSIIRAGQRRVLVLQGIRLSSSLSISMQQSKDVKIAFNDINIINDRVVSIEVPETVKKGNYNIYIGEDKQEVKLTVN